MLLIVEPKTADRPDLVESQRRQQQPDVGDLVRHLVLAEDVAGDDARFLSLSNVRLAFGQDGVARQHLVRLGQEAH